MKKLALALASALVVLLPVSANAQPADPQSDCVVTAMSTGDFQAVLACDDGGATTNSRNRNIDWD